MRKFSFRPALTLRGRAFKGLRGWAGKPLHPPLTDIPVGAYMLAAAFDVISFVGGDDRLWARDFYRAATFALIGGAAVSVLAALTGFWDWKRSTEKGTQARRTVNAHAWTMLTVTALVLAGIAVRVAFFWDDRATPLLALVLTSRPRRSRSSAARSAVPSPTTTASTSRLPATTPSGTSRRPTSFPATSMTDRARSARVDRGDAHGAPGSRRVVMMTIRTHHGGS